MQIVFKNPFLNSKKTQHVSMTTSSWLTLLKEIMAVDYDNRNKRMHPLSGQNAGLPIVTADGALNTL
jgi:hypothetical protein